MGALHQTGGHFAVRFLWLRFLFRLGLQEFRQRKTLVVRDELRLCTREIFEFLIQQDRFWLLKVFLQPRVLPAFVAIRSDVYRVVGGLKSRDVVL